MIGRLHYRRDFDNLRINGKKVKRGFLSVAFNPGDDFSDGVRVAFAIGRSVGGAVVRNRVKRRLREVFHQMINKQISIPSGDYLIRVFPGVENNSFTCLAQTLEKIVEDLRKDIDSSGY